ncbi:hemerythrin domain-containing protein [Zwartia vadi]|uniref:hemerythrin domain-containing protein n=1 Tax=Zwartia vadi TaxID=3058168 RepID=UPI0025B36AD9|nr:hemerythrin domain-containing protein [Zwartia vadi]MDN3986601.1 hemerythrin domain-containing protein [Zwartia vadi]
MTDFFTPHSAGFDSPIELLEACHEKVRRFAKLTQRIAQHIETTGIDSKTREAAQSVLRYFTIAVPLHHQDEEDDLFPALKSLSPATIGEEAFKNLNNSIQELEAEHETLGRLWREIENWLKVIAGNNTSTPPKCLNEFTEKYIQHADLEEQTLYPHARLLAPETLSRLGLKMAERRGHRMLDLNQAI